ncbi:MAG: hypothetical protein P1V20_14995 [Verrucomicrobiales bacterium]|nr:hypothetical protein [Verrucomicrobiales bacterium]
MNYTYLLASASGEGFNQILIGSFATLFAGAIFFMVGYLVGKWIWRLDRHPTSIGKSRDRVNDYQARELEMNTVRRRSRELMEQPTK